MTPEENKAIVRQHYMVLEKGKVNLIDGYYAPDASVTLPGWSTAAKLA